MKDNIKIVQNILKKENQFDLAVKLENCYYEDYQIDNWNGGIGEVLLYVHPNYFLELESINLADKERLIVIFNALPHEYYEITSIKFAINKEIYVENITDTTYIFVDEAGDMDFSQKGSQYYLFNFLVKKRPFKLHEYISNYRYELLEKNLDPHLNSRINIEYFHANNDNKHIKKELFNIISTFDTDSIQVYSYILEKQKVHPDKRKSREHFYIDNLIYSICMLLEKLDLDSNFIIVTDNLPVASNRKKQEKALKLGVSSYIKEHKLNLRYDIFHHCSASSANLQIIDYIGWAINRKYEHNDSSFYEKIKDYILSEDVVTKNREKKYYEK